MKYRICIEKITGKLIECQQGGVDNNINLTDIPKEKWEEHIKFIQNDRLESLKQNAINGGYSKDDIEVKEIDDNEWRKIINEQINKPEEKKIRDLDLKKKEDLIKEKLNLSDDDFKILKEIL